MDGLKNQPDISTIAISWLRFQVERLTLISDLNLVVLKNQPNINTILKSQPDSDFRLKSWRWILVENWYINVGTRNQPEIKVIFQVVCQLGTYLSVLLFRYLSISLFALVKESVKTVWVVSTYINKCLSYCYLIF